MTDVAIQPMMWEATPDISDVDEFSEADVQCFREVRDVLKKHGALDRFGMTLIHKHFEIGPDEVLMEFTDCATRTHTIRPVSLEEVDQSDVSVTHWKLTDGEPVVARTCVCARGPDSHYGYHRNA